MSLYKPYFRIYKDKSAIGDPQILHNCNGGLDFGCQDDVTEETLRLIEFALEEGKRMRSRELMLLLEGK
jgi:hypothetical protein